MEEEKALVQEEEDASEEEIVEAEPVTDEEVFLKIERNYNRVVDELSQDSMYSKFLGNYTRLFNYLCSTRERSLTLEDTHAQLIDTFDTTEERLDAYRKAIEIDEAQIEGLHSEVDTCAKLIENACAREQVAQEVIDSLRKTIASLNAEIDMKNRMAQAELEENPQAAKHRDILEREKTKLISEVSKLSEKLNNALAYQEELERRTSLTDLRIFDISSQLEETLEDVGKVKRNRERLEADIAECTEEMMTKDNEVETLHLHVLANNKLIARYDMQLREQTLATNKCLREMELWSERYTQMQTDFSNMNRLADALVHDNYKALRLIRTKDDEKIRLQIEVTKLVKQREQVDRRTRICERDKMNIMEEKFRLTEIMASMKRDYEAYRMETAHCKELIEEHVKEREILNRNLMRQQAVTKDQQRVLRLQEQTRKRLDREIDEYVIEARHKTKLIKDLIKQRDRLIEDVLVKSNRVDDTTNEINLQNQFIVDVNKLLSINEERFKAKQMMLDIVRGEKLGLQKQMQQGMADNHDVKERLKINHRQSEQLKEGLGCKDVELNKEETIKRKILKMKEVVKIDLNTSVDRVRSLKRDIAEATAEEKRLAKVIDESERLIKEQAKTITVLITERDVLGSQLVRRNDEICLVFEKIKLVRSTLGAAEAEYECRLKDIRLLSVEIKRLRQEEFLLKKCITNMNNYKIQVFHMERELTMERMMSKALEDELHNPMNIHRWRKLSGGDPEMSELLGKTSHLQKRLLNQANEMADVETELREVETLYMNIRLLIAQQPSTKVYNEYNRIQKCLFDGTMHNKCLVSEFNMLDIHNRNCSKALTHTMVQIMEVKAQLEQEKRAHMKERKAIVRGKMLLKRLEGAIVMPVYPNIKDEPSSLSVQSIVLKNKRN